MIRSYPEDQLAATGDTWGIPGPDFLNYYLVLAVAGVLTVLFARRTAVRGAGGVGAIAPGSLDPEQVGYLAGHRTQAYLAALTSLRTQGLLASAGRGAVIATRAPHGPQGPLSELQQAILVVTAPGVRTSSIQSDLRLTAAMTRIRDGLVAGGLLTSRVQQVRARVVTLPLLAIAAVGVARAVTGAHNGKPWGNLAMVLVVLVVLSLILLAAVPIRTSAGTAALRELRASNGHLRVSQHPSWTTYGPLGAGLSVALFGATALFAIDPVFANEARIPRAATSGSSGSGGDGGGGGSSCGGGGCGGGCGG